MPAGARASSITVGEIIAAHNVRLLRRREIIVADDLRPGLVKRSRYRLGRCLGFDLGRQAIMPARIDLDQFRVQQD